MLIKGTFLKNYQFFLIRVKRSAFPYEFSHNIVLNNKRKNFLYTSLYKYIDFQLIYVFDD